MSEPIEKQIEDTFSAIFSLKNTWLVLRRIENEDDLNKLQKVSAATICISLMAVVRILHHWREFWQNVGKTIRRYCSDLED